jgi:ABC-type polysaccharide/polyol phosphate transport system ATPase subunit
MSALPVSHVEVDTEAAPVAMRLAHVSKRYPMAEAGTELKSTLLHPRRAWEARRSRQPLWAVRDVSLDVAKGEFFGIIGANGSGKSTLLRVMAGLSRPSEGTVEASGRLSTLLELGSGFHPNVSGRENAVINGLLIGMTRDEIEALLPKIVAFAGLQDFIDQPMRTYSSGMYVRLGFAIAAYMEPEILLVDEILAVGDGKFQEKCYEHIEMLRDQGVTIIMVSHDLGSVERFATRAALMERGRMVAIGSPKQIVALHLDRLSTTSPEIRAAIGESMEASGHEAIQRFLDLNPEAKARFDEQLAANPAFHDALAEKVATDGASSDGERPR